jgi:hypothetical protein
VRCRLPLLVRRSLQSMSLTGSIPSELGELTASGGLYAARLLA